MNDHPRLRRALDAFSQVPPGIEVGSSGVPARAAALRRRRNATVSGIAVVAVLLGGTGVLQLRPSPDRAVATITTTESPTPWATAEPGQSEAPPEEAPGERPEQPPADATPEPATARPDGISYVQGPYGLTIEVEAEPRRVRTAELVALTIRVKDPSGSWLHTDVRYGDEEPGVVVTNVARADSCTIGPHPPESADDVRDFQHAYRRPGTYGVVVTVRTGGACQDIPAEKATASFTLVVAPGAFPSNGPAEPHASLQRVERNQITKGIENRRRTVWWWSSDDDGWIEQVVLDWGDGTAPEVVRLEQACEETARRWPATGASVETVHEYAAGGTYIVTMTVVSTGCDGADRQVATASTRIDVTLP